MISKKIHNKWPIFFIKDFWNKKIPVYYNLKIFKFLFIIFKINNIWYLTLRKKVYKKFNNDNKAIFNYDIVFLHYKLSK